METLLIMTTKRAAFAMCATVLVLVAACGGGSTAPANNSTGGGNNTGGTTTPLNTINATNSNTFDPNSLTIGVGGTVTWAFAATAHNVIFDAVAGRPADIGGSNASASIARTFATPGTFTYQCTIHAGMSGTVIVTQ
jgi:plastocyanin